MELAVGIFVMIYKKACPEDYVNYRLLNHSYKIATTILLQHLIVECESFFSDWQADFRQKRGCRDNILLLSFIYDKVIKDNEKIVIDFKAVFDSLSHKFIDAALAKRAQQEKQERSLGPSTRQRLVW